MIHTRLTAAILLFLSSAGLCSGANVLPLDPLRGVAGDSVTFATSVKPTAEPHLALTWTFNGTVNVITSSTQDVVGLGYENRIILDKSTGSLVLKNLTDRDSGLYELIIITKDGQMMQGTAKLEVLNQVLISPKVCPKEDLIEGKTFLNLTCDAKGTVSSRVWMKDGRPLAPGGRFSFHDGNRVLSISPVVREDAGTFLCNASNEYSFDTHGCKLKVFYGPDPPVITQDPIGAELEDSVSLRCSAVSLPKATFFWTFKNMIINGPSHYIHEMEKRHLGKYTCTARNAKTGLEVSVSHNLRDSSAPISVSMSVMVCTVLTSLGLKLT